MCGPGLRYDRRMGLTVRWDTLRSLMAIAALLTMFALIAGVRPRALAQETGPIPLASDACFLCDGTATAAAAAPSATSVAHATPALAPAPVLAEAPVSPAVALAPGATASMPPVPPPRA
jgi:hypothetical protein